MTNAESMVGRQIASYKVLSRIARGGMADVHLAEDMGLRRQVMLKIMLPHLAQNEAFLTRFQREARTTARLSHPNIIQVYSTGLSLDGRPYLAMQYIRGGTLHEKLANLAGQGQLLPARTALITVRQFADALSVAHEAGIVHRDLKPNNILRHPDGTQIAFLSERSGSRNLHIMAAGGSSERQVTFDDLGKGHPSWSVNNQLAFIAGDVAGSTWEIYVVDIDGGSRRQLTSNTVSDWAPEWSPDGRQILYNSSISKADEAALFVMNADGSNSHLVFTSDDYEWGADWTPDGDKIVFTRERGDYSYIYVMDADGSNVTYISERGSYLSWAR